jgi:hypothetical protein
MRGDGVKLRPACLLGSALCLALSLAACSLRPRPLAPWPMPGPAAGPIRGNWVQTVRLERGGRELSLLAVIECDGTTLTLAGLTPAGQRLVRIAWRDGRIEQESDPNLPAKVDGEAILRDMVLAYWPKAALDSALAGTEWTLAFADGSRTLSARGKARVIVAPESPASAPAGAAAQAPEAADSMTAGAMTAGGKVPAPGPGVTGDSLSIRHVREGYVVRVATVERTAP